MLQILLMNCDGVNSILSFSLVFHHRVEKLTFGAYGSTRVTTYERSVNFDCTFGTPKPF